MPEWEVIEVEGIRKLASPDGSFFILLERRNEHIVRLEKQFEKTKNDIRTMDAAQDKYKREMIAKAGKETVFVPMPPDRPDIWETLFSVFVKMFSGASLKKVGTSGGGFMYAVDEKEYPLLRT